MATDRFEVQVYVYELTRGLAKSMSRVFLGKQLEGIWHTGIVVYGQEFYFGGGEGIRCCSPGGTILGEPTEKHSLGYTQIPYEMFWEYLRDLAQTTFRPECYHLLNHNCNTFSSEVAQFLTGNDIPAKITSLPAEVMSTPLGQMIRPFIDAMSIQPSGGHAVLPHAPSTTSGSSASHLNKSSNSNAHQPPSATRVPASSCISNRESFVFKEDLPDISQWKKDIKGVSDREQMLIKEVYEFLSEQANTWSLGRNHLTTIRRLVLDLVDGCDVPCVKLLSRLVLRDDILQMLYHDNQSSLIIPDIMAYFDTFSKDVKICVVKMLTNCSSTPLGLKLMLGIDGQMKQLTTICVYCLLGDHVELMEAAAALVYNLTLEKMPEDMEVELGSALLNCVDKTINEQIAYFIVAAIAQVMKSNEEVKALAHVLGTRFDNLIGKSDRIAAICKTINIVTQF